MPTPRKVRARGSDFTARLAEYVNDTFNGNLTLAAKAMQMDYDQLNRLASGRTTRPSLEFLEQLIYFSGKDAYWWITGKEQQAT